jgi:hypothetical protein
LPPKDRIGRDNTVRGGSAEHNVVIADADTAQLGDPAERDQPAGPDQIEVRQQRDRDAPADGQRVVAAQRGYGLLDGAGDEELHAHPWPSFRTSSMARKIP